MTSDYEDKFLRLRDEHRELQQRHNEAEEQIRRLNTMLQQIENAWQKKARGEASADGSMRRPVNRENEELIKEMFDKNKALVAANKRLEAKNKQLIEQLEKKKRELQLAKKHALVRRNAAGPPASLNASRPLTAPNGTASNDEFAALSHARLLEITKRLQSRLKETEKALEAARNENAALKENSAMHANVSGAALGDRTEQLPIEARELQLRLKESQTQLHLLQRRYDALASQSDAQTQRHLDYEEQIHGYASRIKELKNALEELMHEKGLAEMKASRLQAAEEELAELRATNRMLEDKIKRLGEVPFISDAFHQNDLNARLAMLEAERGEHITKIQHLQEAARTHHSALVTLQQQASQLRDEKEVAIRQLEEMNIRYQQSETGNQLLSDRLRIYAGEDVDMKDLDRALTIVRRRTDAGNALDFLQPVEEGDASDPSGAHMQLRRKLESIQVLNLNLTQENERLENMLKSQSAINRELQKELEDVLRRQAMDKGELLQCVNDLEAIAAKRQQKVLQLEAQLRELMYSGKKKGKQVADAPHDVDQESDADADDTLMEDLLLDGEYSAGDNLVEIWVQNAQLRDGIVAAGACTFVTVDFFTFESQATSLLVGNKPAYDFAASYKIAVDDLFLVYLATQTASFELLQAVQGDFVTLGRCTISLKDLLRHKPKFTKTAHLLSVQDSSVIGELTVRFRMAMPIVELYRVFLERNPAQRDTIKRLQQQLALANLPQDAVEEKAILQKQLAVVNAEDESRLYNELEIRVESASDLRVRNLDPSSLQTYVHFKLLGFPHSLTEFTFPIITDDKQRQLLRKGQLVFNVINYVAGAEGKLPTIQDDGFIGEAAVPIAQLADGHPVAGEYAVVDKMGKPVGKLRLQICWLYPFRTERQLSPNALSSAEVAEVVMRFKANDRDGLVDSMQFARFVDPSVTALVALNKLANYVSDKVEQNGGQTTEEVLSAIKPQSGDFEVDALLTALLPLQVGLASDDIVSLFEMLDVRAAGKVRFDQLLWAVDLERAVPPILLAKLRQRAHAVRERGKTCVQLFVKLDSAGDGFLAERKFKEGLRAMGFDLVDEPDTDDAASVDFLRLSGQRDEPLDSELMSHAQRQALQADGATGRYGPNADDGDLLTSREELPLPSTGSQFDRQEKEREEFNRRRRELQRRSEERAALSTQVLRESTASLTEPAVAQTFTVRDSGERDLDEAHAHAAATILQTQYRRFREQRQPKLHATASPVAASTAGRPPRHPTSTRSSSQLQAQSQQQQQHQQRLEAQSSTPDAAPLIVAEDALRSALNALKAVRPPPDLMEWFGKVDQRNAGVVGQKQFLYVLSKYPDLKLEFPERKAFAEYFERAADEIDYHAFIRFVLYQPPRVPQFVQDLSSMVFTVDVYFQLRSLDAAGFGVLPRSAVKQLLCQLGYAQFTESSFRAMFVPFELRGDDEVDYRNFFETVRSNDLSQEYEEVCAALRHAVKSSIRHTGDLDEALRHCFARIDRARLASCSLDDLAAFLQDMKLGASQAVIAALYRTIDRAGAGIHFADFKQFILHDDTEPPAPRLLSLPELQHKAYAVLFDYEERGQADAVTHAFYLYDWAGKGHIGRSEFVRAASRCGLLFTPQEYGQLMSEFVSDDGVHVSYLAFLDWARPPRQGTARFSSTTHAAEQAHNVIGSKLAEAWNRGVNLAALFKRYDRRGSGKISPSDFCSVLAVIGDANFVVDEVIAFADRTKVLDGNQIRYLSLLSDLEQQAPTLTGRTETPLQHLARALGSGAGVESFLRACQAYDLDGHGKIERQDVPRVLRKLKVDLAVDEIDAVCDQFAVGGREVDFRRMVEHLLKTADRLMSSQQFVATKSMAARNLPAGLGGKITSWLKSLIQRGVDFRAELDDQDKGGRGTILLHDFRACLQTLNHPFDGSEVVAIENAYKDPSQKRGEAAVNHVAMLNEHHPKHADNPNVASSMLELWKLSEDVRLKIRRNCNYWMPGDLKLPFSHFDPQRKGVITETGLVKGLGAAYLNMNVHPTLAKALFDEMRLGNPNGVGYCEFVVFVLDPFHTDVADKLRRELARVGVSKREVVRVCLDCDDHNAGQLTTPQLLRFSKRLGLNLSTSDAQRLARRCDPAQEGLLQISLFEQWLSDLISADASAPDDGPVLSQQLEEDLLREHFVLLRRAVQNKYDAGHSAGEIWNLFEPERSDYLTPEGLFKGAKALSVRLQRSMVRPLLTHLESLAGAAGEVTRSNLLKVFDVRSGYSSPLRRSAGGKMREGEEEEEGRFGDAIRPPRHRVERALMRLHDLLYELLRTRRSYKQIYDMLTRQCGDAVAFHQLQDFVHQLVPAASSADLRDIFDFLVDREGQSVPASTIALELTPPTRHRLSASFDDDRASRRLLQIVLTSCRRSARQVVDLIEELQPDEQKSVLSVARTKSFEMALDRIGCRLSMADMRELMELLDPDNAGVVKYREFADFVTDNTELRETRK